MNKLITVVVVATAVFLTACGDPTKTKKDEVVSLPSGQVTANNTNQAPQPAIFPQRMNGMYDGLGQESMQQQVYTPTPVFPSFRQWFTRIEFLKEDGSNVDPLSFNLPRGVYSHIRLSLISDVNTTIQYVVEGYVWINPQYGLTGTLRSYNAGNVAFDIEFGLGMGTGPLFDLWSEGRLREGSGTIVLTEPAGKHIIKY